MVQEAEDSFGIIRVLERMALGSSSFLSVTRSRGAAVCGIVPPEGVPTLGHVRGRGPADTSRSAAMARETSGGMEREKRAEPSGGTMPQTAR